MIPTPGEKQSDEDTDLAGRGSEGHFESTTRASEGALSESINFHSYPRLLHRSGLLFRAFHVAVHVTTLRNWYVRSWLRRLLARHERESPALTILDIGCGSGDHSFYSVRRVPRARIIGIDRAGDAVQLCRAHASGEDRMHFRQADVEALDELPKADLILCITVLQYIDDDLALTGLMSAALRPRGILLLYVPIRNERLLQGFDRLLTGSRSDYDAAQGRKRVYSEESTRELLERSGFRIERTEQAYGWFGKLSFELHRAVLHGVTGEHIGVRIASALTGLLVLPLILWLMLLDFALPVRRGNGLVVVARAPKEA